MSCLTLGILFIFILGSKAFIFLNLFALSETPKIFDANISYELLVYKADRIFL